MNRFDEMAETWDMDPQKVERAAAVARQIRNHVSLNRGMKALEFGCGTGLLSFALKDDLGHITLVDNSQGMLEVLKRKIDAGGVKNMTPLLLDLAGAEKEPADKFDLVFTMMALHHIPGPERVIAALYALLEAGGYLAVAELEKGESSFHGPEFDGHDGFPRQKLADMAQKAGFQSIRLCDCFVIQREIDGDLKNFNVFLMTCQKK